LGRYELHCKETSHHKDSFEVQSTKKEECWENYKKGSDEARRLGPIMMMFMIMITTTKMMMKYIA
jgi:hypothetical protein